VQRNLSAPALDFFKELNDRFECSVSGFVASGVFLRLRDWVASRRAGTLV